MAGEPVELYRARGLPEAYALAARLEAADVPAVIDNEHLQGAVGEIPGGWVTAPRILVAEEYLAIARDVLAEFLRPPAAPAGGLKCLACDAPMGDGAVCPVCGWTYGPDPDDPEPEATAPEPVLVAAPADRPIEQVVGPAVPRMTRRALWAEVGVVLAVEVIPRIVNPIGQPPPTAPPPYWSDTLYLTVISACTTFVVVYLIARSGEPWARFGLDRPRAWDFPLGLGMVLVSEAVFLLDYRLGFFADAPDRYQFPRPAGPADLVMGVVKYGAAGFMEELVFRAYLITRLTTLLRTRGWALVVAALLFGVVHGYQGAAGVMSSFLFGLAYGAAYLGVRRVWPLAIGHALTNLILDYAR
jgi:membrane protease YdiL (CAAX protease family)